MTPINKLGVISMKTTIKITLLVLMMSCSNSKAPKISEVEHINCKDSVVYWGESSRESYKEVVDSSLHYMKYIFSDSIEAYASYSNNELVAIGKKFNGSHVMLMECYSNSQAKGDVKFNKSGVIHGKAKYYYSNGRVKETGYFANGEKVKEWKEYDRNGRLERTTIYSKPNTKN